jgi:plastocyanin
MKPSALIALAVVSVGLAACGGDDAGEQDDGNAPQELNGCTASSFADLSEQAEPVVQIASEGLKFTPPCVATSPGQTLRFEGSLTAHPLAPGNAEDSAAGSPNNPIERISSGSSVELRFDAAGTYPYYCELHSFGAGMGMAGAVYVR